MTNFKIPAKTLEIAHDIKTMRIRGAGRIARAAAEALKIAAKEYKGGDVEEFKKYLKHTAKILLETRPTAVSLPNAITLIISRIERTKSNDIEELKNEIVRVADEFIEYSRRAVEIIGNIGAKRIEDGDTILTHCNSTAAASIIINAHRQGKRIKVYATETRPKFQGHITSKVLSKEGIGVTLITDSAVRFFMKDVDKVIVGADTVTANGAVVNKIGTSQIALIAHEARVRVFVAAETYKFSPLTVIGELVVIEERDPTEIVPREYLLKNPNVIVRNPAFDVTPPEYIDAIITERGMIPPRAAILVLRDIIGWKIKPIEYKVELSEDEGEYLT